MGEAFFWRADAVFPEVVVGEGAAGPADGGGIEVGDGLIEVGAEVVVGVGGGGEEGELVDVGLAGVGGGDGEGGVVGVLRGGEVEGVFLPLLCEGGDLFCEEGLVVGGEGDVEGGGSAGVEGKGVVLVGLEGDVGLGEGGGGAVGGGDEGDGVVGVEGVLFVGADGVLVAGELPVSAGRGWGKVFLFLFAGGIEFEGAVEEFVAPDAPVDGVEYVFEELAVDAGVDGVGWGVGVDGVGEGGGGVGAEGEGEEGGNGVGRGNGVSFVSFPGRCGGYHAAG